MKELTQKQGAILNYIVTFQEQTGYPPSVREIASHMGLKSPSTVHAHLQALKEAGMIASTPGKIRAISVCNTPSSENQVPLVGRVAAGAPILAETSIEGYLPFPTHGKGGEYFALTVRGDSMRDAGILEGDYIIVHQQDTFRNRDIVVALFEEEATVKTYSMKQGHLWLLPENPDYPPISGEGCQLLGKVVGVQRHY